MDWVNEVYKKWKRKNQILFSKESDFLQDLILVINKITKHWYCEHLILRKKL